VNSIFGTPLYMSPEQTLSSGSVDHRADLWALSVVTFQMLTGTCPFVGPTPAAVGMKIQAGEFGLPSELRPELPKAVDAWFKRALNRDIEARFASAGELFREFRRALLLPGAPVAPTLPVASSHARTLLQRAPAPAPASAPAIEVAPPRRTHRLPTFLVALSVIAVGLVVGFVVVRNLRPVETKKTQPPAVPTRVVASSTEAYGEARPDRPPTQPDPLLAERDASAPLAVRSEPPAQPAHRAVKAKNALSAPATNAPLPAATQKPLKDRGF